MIGITMRMDIKEYPGGKSEFRNSIASDWTRFLNNALPGYPYIFLPNMEQCVISYAEMLGITGVIFSGGDDWGIYPQRDASEKTFFSWAKKRKLPMFGVCRGAQIINMFMGGQIGPCGGHVASRHEIFFPDAGQEQTAEVNSFHSNGIFRDGLATGLSAFAVAPDGSIEGFWGETDKICGVMWHPERGTAPTPLDIELLLKIFGESLHD